MSDRKSRCKQALHRASTCTDQMQAAQDEARGIQLSGRCRDRLKQLEQDSTYWEDRAEVWLRSAESILQEARELGEEWAQVAPG